MTEIREASFDEFMMAVLHKWYPDRSYDSIRSTLNGFYTWQQTFPDKEGNLPEHCEQIIVNMACIYRSLDSR